MAKKLRIQDRILLGLALVGDLIDQTLGKAVYDSHWIRKPYFWTPPDYKPINYYQTIRRMLKTGYIEKIIKFDRPYLRLTSEGKKKIKRDFSWLSMKSAQWNGKWCLVIFDIKEKDKKTREALRRKLRSLGFGLLQKSIYISPYDLIEDMVEFLSSYDLLGKVLVLSCQHRFMGDARKLADFIWKTEKINKKYKKIYIKMKQAIKNKKLEWLKLLKEEYLEMLFEDPLLPAELLPKNWFADKIQALLSPLKL